MSSLAIVLSIAFASAYLIWIAKLSTAKERALLDYGARVGDHGRLIRRRWIETVPDEAYDSCQGPNSARRPIRSRDRRARSPLVGTSCWR